MKVKRKMKSTNNYIFNWNLRQKHLILEIIGAKEIKF